MKSDLFKKLNLRQQEAVGYVRKPSIILAGAGSGKTKVLVCKVLHLVKSCNVLPQSVVMITFTNKAASEMRQRLETILSQKKLGFIGTFHSFCVRILRVESEAARIPKDFIIYDEADQISLVKSITDTKKHSASYFLDRISHAKNELISPQNYLRVFHDHLAKEVFAVYKNYQKELKENSALDFDDLIIKTIELFIENPVILEKYQGRYKFFLVDEFQDTNLAQYTLTLLLSQKYKNITVVGDFSQSIYSWRGADIRNLEKFQKDFPNAKIFYLETNYRSSQNILDFAHKVIQKNTGHPILHLKTDSGEGEEVTLFEAGDEQEEALFVTQEYLRLNEDFTNTSSAVLYRTNAQSRVLEEALLHFGVPYVLIGGTRFYERKEIKDILSYLRLLINKNNKIAQERIGKLGKSRWKNFNELLNASERLIMFPTENIIEEIFKTTKYLDFYNRNDAEDFARLENIKELKSVAISFPNIHEFLEQVALVESEYFESEKRNKNLDGIRLMTLHQAKGLEFDSVFIVGVEEGILPHSRSMDDFFQLEEERRLFYVGITRARKKLYITSARKRFIFGRRNYAIKSRFLLEEEAQSWYNM